jgi:hypothetical protein
MPLKALDDLVREQQEQDVGEILVPEGEHQGDDLADVADGKESGQQSHAQENGHHNFGTQEPGHGAALSVFLGPRTRGARKAFTRARSCPAQRGRYHDTACRPPGTSVRASRGRA